MDPGAERSGRPLVLIVDDDRDFTTTLAHVITAKGYDPVVAHSGKEAIQTIAHIRPDLALVDLKLPDIDGAEVLAQIKAGSPRTEVIILTGYATPDTARGCLNLGAFDYLQKP